MTRTEEEYDEVVVYARWLKELISKYRALLTYEQVKKIADDFDCTCFGSGREYLSDDVYADCDCVGGFKYDELKRFGKD
jgi:hypothetical protein